MTIYFHHLSRTLGSRQDVFCKKGVLANSEKIHRKTNLCQSIFFNKVAGLRLWYWCFPVIFTKFLRIPVLTEHIWWLLLGSKLKNCYREQGIQRCPVLSFQRLKRPTKTKFFPFVILKVCKKGRSTSSMFCNNCFTKYLLLAFGRFYEPINKQCSDLIETSPLICRLFTVFVKNNMF